MRDSRKVSLSRPVIGAQRTYWTPVRARGPRPDVSPFWGSGGSCTGGSAGTGSCVLGGVTEGPVLPGSPVFTEPPPGRLDLLGHLHRRLRERLRDLLDRLGSVLDGVRSVLDRIAEVLGHGAHVAVLEVARRLLRRHAYGAAHGLDRPSTPSIVRPTPPGRSASARGGLPRRWSARHPRRRRERLRRAGRRGLREARPVRRRRARSGRPGRHRLPCRPGRSPGRRRHPDRRLPPAAHAAARGVVTGVTRAAACAARSRPSRPPPEGSRRRQLAARSLVGHSGAARGDDRRDQNRGGLARERGALLDPGLCGGPEPAGRLVQPAAQERRQRQEGSDALGGPARAALLEARAPGSRAPWRRHGDGRACSDADGWTGGGGRALARCRPRCRPSPSSCSRTARPVSISSNPSRRRRLARNSRLSTAPRVSPMRLPMLS